MRLGFFEYKNKFYTSGTKVLFKGKCFLGDKEVYLSNVVVEFMYTDNGWVFKYDDNIYVYKSNKHTPEFWQKQLEGCIVEIITDQSQISHKQKTKEVIWTDGMVAATIWYVVVMLFATIFYARVGIWIIATIIWRSYINKNKIVIEK